MKTFLTLHNKTEFFSKHLNEYIYNLLDTTFEIPQTFQYNVMSLTPNYIARPDLLSQDLYGTDEYADIICKINGISNPFEFNCEDLILVPKISSIYDFNVTPTILEVDKEKNKYTPSSKQKNEKRKPNETIIGDKRFTIDTKNRIVIY